MFDSGSMCSFITEHATQLLRTSHQKTSHPGSGISTTITHKKIYSFMFVSLQIILYQHITAHTYFTGSTGISVSVPHTELLFEIFYRMNHETLSSC